MPRLGGEREVLMVALRLVWHLWASVPLPWLASAAGLSSFGGGFLALYCRVTWPR